MSNISAEVIKRMLAFARTSPVFTNAIAIIHVHSISCQRELVRGLHSDSYLIRSGNKIIPEILVSE